MQEYLLKAVESVVQQDYKTIELIIVDDGSERPLNADQLKLDDLDTTILKIKHSGKPSAVNKGFKEAGGEYIVILDADDELPASSIRNRLTALENKNADLCIGSFETRYQGDAQALRSVRRFKNLSREQLIRTYISAILSPFHQNAMMFHRDLLDRTGKMDPAMIRGQDKDFAIRLLQESEHTTFIDESVYIYNRYDRGFKARIFNRYIGMKYLLRLTAKHMKGWRRGVYLMWVFLVETAKMVHDLFGVYKK